MSGNETIQHPQLGHAGLVVTLKDKEILGKFGNLDEWSLSSDSDANGLELADGGIRKPKLISFDKVNTAINTNIAAIENSSLNFDLSRFPHDSLIRLVIVLPTLTDVQSVFVDLGTDENNKINWITPVGSLTAGEFIIVEKQLLKRDANFGIGIDLSSIKYIKTGVLFNSEINTLNDILIDEVSIIAP